MPLTTVAVLRGLRPMLDHGIEFLRRGDQAELIRVGIDQSSVEDDLVAVQAVRGFKIRIPDRVERLLFSSRGCIERGKNYRYIAALVFGPANNTIPIAFRCGGTCL